MSVTITIVVDDTGTAVSTREAGAPGVVAASHGEADAAPPTLFGGPETDTEGVLSGGDDERPPLEPAALGLGTDEDHGDGGGPPPADLLVKPDEDDADEEGGKPMPLEALGEASQSTGRRPARGK